jgi:hypothetical protein
VTSMRARASPARRRRLPATGVDARAVAVPIIGSHATHARHIASAALGPASAPDGGQRPPQPRLIHPNTRRPVVVAGRPSRPRPDRVRVGPATQPGTRFPGAAVRRCGPVHHGWEECRRSWRPPGHSRRPPSRGLSTSPGEVAAFAPHPAVGCAQPDGAQAACNSTAPNCSVNPNWLIMMLVGLDIAAGELLNDVPPLTR